MTKKSQTTTFLWIIFGIFIAVLMFLPGCIAVNELFRLSGQGKTSFDTLGNTIEEVNKGNVGDSVGSVVFLDDKTTILGFSKGTEKIELKGKALTSFYLRPGVCTKDNACLVLCRNFEVKEFSDWKLNAYWEYQCKDINSDEYKTFSFDLTGICKVCPKDAINCYTECKGGFVTERGTLGKMGGYTADMPRERVVYSQKGDSFVVLCENPDTEKGCIP